MNHEEKTYALLHKYYFAELDPSEKAELSDILNTMEDEKLVAILSKVFEDHIPSDEADVPDPVLQQRIEQILATDKPTAQPPQHTIFKLRRYRYIAAAAIALLISVLGITYMVTNQEEPTDNIASETSQNPDFQPGKNGAILTLSDGTKVVLDSLGNSNEAITVDGVRLLVKNGQLTYADTDTAPTKPVYNTMTTPKGRQYQLVLSDGTKVWLNAASSITYPVVFEPKSSRDVRITGEAYFEVSSSKDHPFTVSIADKPTKIQVLGTKFNINAYDDRSSIQTTLLEGKVTVGHGPLQKTLNPGQQASIHSHSNNINISSDIDLAHIMAWKNDIFSFKDVKIDALMNELARWYDIEVQFKGAIPAQRYSGKIDKQLTLKQVLSLLGATHVKYTLDGDRTITIYN